MNVAFIPVRGGSKSIPLKNIRHIAGQPLVYWTAKAASTCKEIDQVFVSTDNDMIKEIVEGFHLPKVSVVGRSAESASDTASTEYAMMEFAKEHDFENIVLVQATSPLLTAEDLSNGFELYYKKDTDSVLSVVRQKRFQWSVSKEGITEPLNYNIYKRPRRQEFEGYFVENGAFYITSKKALMESNNRISGRIRAYEMDESTYFEIDEPVDWQIIEKQLEMRTKKNDKLEIPEIKMFLTDCDGCLTDGGMYYSENGEELKKFNTLDGMGLSLLRERGIIVGMITGEKVALNRNRSEKLHLDVYEEGVENKLEVIKQLCYYYGVGIQNVVYIGDDVNDLEAIKAVGFGCSVQNGMKPVRDAAKYVTKASGGHGAIREVVELILRS